MNLFFMVSKLTIYFLILIFIFNQIQLTALVNGPWRFSLSPIMVLITSFGFAVILPSLTQYFEQDPKLLKLAVVVGSLVPLFCYLIWDAAVMGVIPFEGKMGLQAILATGDATGGMSRSLSFYAENRMITDLFRLFTALTLATAFLGVSLALSDFFADGLGLAKQAWQGVLVFAFTFLPPLFLVIFFPHIFILALGYAGIFCVILLVFLPFIMTFSVRRMSLPSRYRAPGGDLFLILGMVIAIFLLAMSLFLG